jgi:hypothetical protein
MPDGASAIVRKRTDECSAIADTGCMNPTIDIRQRLLHYLAAVGPTVGRIFGIRDFNAQVMMNAFSAQDRDGLQPALDGLVAEGILSRVSTTDYCLTASGTRLVQGKKHSVEPWCDAAREDPKWS